MKKRIYLLIFTATFTIIPAYYFKNNENACEELFAKSIYPPIGYFLRAIGGKIPFSWGDCFYLCLIGCLLYLLIRLILAPSLYWKRFFVNISLFISLLAFCFYWFWGYNYYRKPLKAQLGYSSSYNAAEMLSTTQFLLQRANALQLSLTNDAEKKVIFPYKASHIASHIAKAYEKAYPSYRFLKYEAVSIKTSVWSKLLSYMGYSGYLNPFTGEAQINQHLPLHSLPFTAAHEAGHQVGFSSEADANFIAYLVLSQSDDPYLRYSSTLIALQYLLSEVRRSQNSQYEALHHQANKGVLLSYQESYEFWKKHENPFEPLFKHFYDYFLKINNQHQGIKSYGLVTELIIAHHKKEVQQIILQYQ